MDLMSSELIKTQYDLLLLLENDLFYLLAELGILKITKEVFDQQMILFKRLVNNLVCDQNESCPLPLINALQNPTIVNMISQCLGIYLLEYTKYDEMTIFHFNFVVNFLPKILEVYKKFPGLLETWLQYISQKVLSNERSHGLNSLKFDCLDNRKRFALYDLLFSLMFTEDCQDPVIEEYFLELILILNNSQFPFLFVWLQQFSNIIQCFVNRFTKIFDVACKKEGYCILEYQRFLRVFCKILLSFPSEYQKKCLTDFDIQFFQKCLDYNDEDNPVVFNFVIKTIQSMLPFASEIIFEEFIEKAFQNNNFTKIITNCFFKNQYLGTDIMALTLFNDIIEANHIALIQCLFCSKDTKAYTTDLARPNEEFRIKAMQVSRMEYTDEYFPDTYSLYILKKFEGKYAPVHYLIYNSEKLIPRLISENLLTYFQNNNDCNKLLSTLVVNILSFGGGKICNICSNDTRSEFCDIEHISEFLFEAFLNYSDMIIEHNQKKYQTMSSTTAFQKHEYLRPTTKFLSTLSSIEYKAANATIDQELLTKNMNSFLKLFNEIFFCIKIRQIIYNNVKS